MKKLEILVVEDTAALREEMALLLELEGFAVQEADNGETALEMLESYHPDLILCDVMMPGMDGHSFAKRVRSNPRLVGVPFVFVSALSSRQHIRAGMMLGADDYIPKPFTSDELLGAIRMRLERTQQVAGSYEQRIAELQAHMAGAQKQELMGQITGGLIHDFNNLITIISSYANLATSADGESALQQDLSEIRLASQKAAGLSRQIVDIVRKRERSVVPVAVERCLRGPVELMSRVLPRDIKVEVEGGAMAGEVLVDIQEIEQVILNLFINSRDAMPHGGTIRLSAAPSPTFSGEGTPRGVRLTVSDDGTGVDASIHQRVFEPFFTTKDEGKSSGLGLSTARRLVEGCGGKITLESEAGAGTKVHVDLPFVEQG
jgi:signal transduction histidine kinase